MIEILQILGSFTAPVDINTTTVSTLWLIPLAASIAIVYKATKLEQITPAIFIKETAALFITIVAVTASIALCLLLLAQFVIT